MFYILIIKMEMKELLDFVDRTLSEAGKWTFYRDQDMTKRIFAGTLKLTEEVGELSSEILWHTWFVRQEKIIKYSPETLKDEFADVIFVTFRLAKLMNIDIESALQQKMEKIKTRTVSK
jgi:NTP pyrophosphatase (non-canonical NTP hydrolase)